MSPRGHVKIEHWLPPPGFDSVGLEGVEFTLLISCQVPSGQLG